MPPYLPLHGHRRRKRGTGAAAAVTTALLVTGAALPAPTPAPTPVAAQGKAASADTASDTGSRATTFRTADIRARDGVVLKGGVVTPAPGTSGADRHGRYPAIVLPASWGVNNLVHIAQARSLAADGYVVVTYTPRGFWRSGGEVDVAGPKDVADITSVVDWTLAHTPADPERLGMTGVSLGGGLTLMGAAFDKRIKAVAAMSGWGDLAGSLYSGQTRHLQSVAALFGVEALTGRSGEELKKAVAAHFAGRDSGQVVEWARVRSPATYVDRINANGTAVFLGNAWGDSVFNPSQIVAFHERLTVPKRLELRPGEHATTELTSFLGLPSGTWAGARRWLDHHLKDDGDGDGDSSGGGVELEPRRSGERERYADWDAVSSRTERLALGPTEWLGTGSLGGTPRTGWRTSVVGGLDSGADGGTTILSGLLDQVAGLPPTVSVPLLPRAFGAVWQSGPHETRRRIRGAVRLHTTVTSAAPDGTAVAYLYDVDALGFGKLVTHAPQSWTGRTPGKAFPLDISMFATAYDVPAGHRLALVVDTADPLYGGRTPLPSKVSFGSPDGDPSELAVPLR